MRNLQLADGLVELIEEYQHWCYGHFDSIDIANDYANSLVQFCIWLSENSKKEKEKMANDK